MSLATRFGYNSSSVTSRVPLTNDQLRSVAPSIFAEHKHESRSEKYTYIPTIEVLDGLRREGFQPFTAVQAKSRIPGYGDFTKHMIRLRQETQITAPEANEVVLVNSHNGTSSYQLMAGKLRFVCMNGLVVGDCFEDVRVPHKGNIVDEVIEGAFTIIKQFAEVDSNVIEMKALPLSDGEQQVFAEAALVARYGEEEKPPVTTAQVLRPRRNEDADPSIWSVFNRTQESLVRGGLSGTAAHGQRRRTRAVNSIDGNVRLNRALWTLAEGMRKLKAA